MGLTLGAPVSLFIYLYIGVNAQKRLKTTELACGTGVVKQWCSMRCIHDKVIIDKVIIIHDKVT